MLSLTSLLLYFSNHSAVSKVIKDVVIGDSGGNNDSARTREEVIIKK